MAAVLSVSSATGNFRLTGVTLTGAFNDRPDVPVIAVKPQDRISTLSGANIRLDNVRIAGNLVGGSVVDLDATINTVSAMTAIVQGARAAARGVANDFVSAEPIVPSNFVFENLVVEDNESLFGSAGIHLPQSVAGDLVTITDSTFQNNTGLLSTVNLDAPALVERCRFIGNSSDDSGGIAAARGLALANSLFAGNTSSAGAAGLFLAGDSFASLAEITNCTFVGNTAFTAGAIALAGNGVALITNSVFWDNTAFTDRDHIDVLDPAAVAVVSHSVVQGGDDQLSDPFDVVFVGQGVSDADPLLDSEGRPLPGSPVIDAGANWAAEGTEGLDLDRSPRFIDAVEYEDTGVPSVEHIRIADIGCYEVPADFAAPCPADMDRNQQLTFFDLVEYLTNFANRDLSADLDGDNEFGFFDLVAYLDSFSQGCP